MDEPEPHTNPPTTPPTPATDTPTTTGFGWPCLTNNGIRLRYNPDPPHPKQAAFLATTCDELFFGGSGGGGKGLPRSQPVVTPHGFRAIGDLKVGDRVINPDGSESRIVAVHDRGIQRCYRVGFSDGASVVCDEDHLWSYRLSNRPRKRDLDWKVATTPQLAEMVAKATSTTTKNKPWPNIPLAEPVKWAGITSRNPAARWPVDPYALGVLLGDGSLTITGQVWFASADDQIVAEMTRWAATQGATLSYDGGVVYKVLGGGRKPIRAALEALDVCHRADNKAVPRRYLVAPIHIRLALVQGLMDTDGTADSRGHASFTSVSQQLAHDVQFLLRSLGYKATITDRIGSYRNDSGELVECQTAYTVFVSGRDATDLFRLERKRARCGPVQQGGTRRVVAVEPVEPEETVCITVDNPNGLFITGHDFIVTHNSYSLLAAALQFVDVPGYSALILRRKLTDLSQPGALISMSQEWLDNIPGASFNKNERKWTFDTGPGNRPATLQFGYLDHPTDIGRYRGTEYHFCVESSTPILMGDESWKPICDIVVGEQVMTLQGPRRVTATHRPGVKPLVSIETIEGTTLVSLRHRVLCADGTWATPEEIAVSSTDDRTDGKGPYSASLQGSLPHRWSAQLAVYGQGGTSARAGQVCHPYTKEPVTLPSGAVHISTVDMALAGEAEVCDLTVSGASHYIAWGGIVSANCGWDELGEFPSEDAYTFLFSRLRKPSGLDRASIIRRFGQAPDGVTLLDIPLRVRSASNPGGPGSAWVSARFVEPATAKAPFIPSSYRENPAIRNEEYEQALAKLSEIERRRMGDGDWTIQEIPGALWKLEDIGRDDWHVDVVIDGGDSPDLVVARPWNITDDPVNRFARTIMGIDPSVGEGKGDECGIVVGGQEESGRVVVLDDLSLQAHPDDWSQVAIRNYHLYGCTKIVIEDNQGKVTLETQLNSAADKLGLARPKLQRRNATGTKEQRAGVAQQLYTGPRPMVVHVDDLKGGKLEAQMVGWVPGAPKSQQTVNSPDRVDALVWMVSEMLYPQGSQVRQTSRTKSKLSSW